MCDALGMLGIRTAHLGRIYGSSTAEHNDPQRLKRMLEQIELRDFSLDILQECEGLADYPACIPDVIEALDLEFPGSLFINVKRDVDRQRWIQSVERQFVGLQLLKSGRVTTTDEKDFMRVVRRFRELTFGQAEFDAERYVRAYDDFQATISSYFKDRANDLLQFDSVQALESEGFSRLAVFLQTDKPDSLFPKSNTHSQLPAQRFLQALEAGEIESQTGIVQDRTLEKS